MTSTLNFALYEFLGIFIIIIVMRKERYGLKMGCVRILLQLLSAHPNIPSVCLDEAQIEKIVMVHRHGHRTPLRLRLGDFEGSLGHYICRGGENDCILGQLTMQGKLSMFLLGSWMKERYPLFTGSLQGNSVDVHVRSSNYERTIGSSAWLIAGLFPHFLSKGDPLTLASKIPDLFQFTIKPVAEETLYPNAGCKVCDRYRELKRQWRHGHKSRATHDYLMAKYRHLFDQMPEKRRSIHGLFDALYCRARNGLSLPPGADEKTISELGDYSASDWFSAFRDNDQICRLGIGRVIGEIKDHLIATPSATSTLSNPSPKLVILSGHDSTIGPLLASFRVPDYAKWPPFCANIIFELHKINSREDVANAATTADVITTADAAVSPLRFVRLNYNGVPQILEECQGGYHPQDPTLCSLARFRDICDKFIPANYESECTV